MAKAKSALAYQAIKVALCMEWRRETGMKLEGREAETQG